MTAHNLFTNRYDAQHHERHPVAIAVEIDGVNHKHDSDCCRVRPPCMNCHNEMNDDDNHSTTTYSKEEGKANDTAAAAASKTKKERVMTGI